MDIFEKIDLLTQNLNRAKLDLSYSMRVAWGNDAETEKFHMQTLINNARLLFVQGRINQLDYEERERARRTNMNELDKALARFPMERTEETKRSM